MKTVIEMAGEVDAVTKVLLDRKEPQGMSYDVFIWFLERFAELARADEREACAKECEHTAVRMGSEWMAHHCAAAIRARGNT